MASYINPEEFTKQLSAYVRKDLDAACEKVVLESLVKYERELRQTLAHAVLMLMERDFRMDRREEDLIITVRHLYGDKK